MPYVDARGKVVSATDAQQAARAKTTVELVENDDGSFSYATHVYLKGFSPLTGTFDVTIGGATPQSDSFQDALGESHTAQVVKLRLGAEGIDGGLVASGNPIPTVNQDQLALLAEALGELKVIRLLLEGVVK